MEDTLATQKPKVAVIGAGISGLTTGKNLGDYGIDYTVYESGDRVGGNWAFKNSNGHSSAYRSLHIDTSKEGLRFRDFAISKAYPDFPHHTQVQQYLEDYCLAFNIKRHIRFETPVKHARRLPGGGWELTTAAGESDLYDALVVANGHHWDPRYAEFPGEFTGEQMHSHYYIDPSDPKDLRGKRILVVGIGNSASDITSELSQKSNRNQVFLSTRSGAWVVPKYLMGVPVDQLLALQPRLPLRPQKIAARILPKLLSGNMENYGLPRPDHNFMEAHPTQSAELLVRLGSGDVVAKPNVQALEGNKVRFVDGSVEEVDVIIWATGYNISFPFFDAEFLSAPGNKIDLFKRMFKPGVDDLVLVGFGQALPTLFPFVECQAQLAARYLAGTYRTPDEAAMHLAIARDDKRDRGHVSDRPRHTQQMDTPVYNHDINHREIPAGTERARRLGPVVLAGRAAQHLEQTHA
ncbi:NAD(P)-binding domain-containing protein [Mycolicibacterium sp. lyk4-40-TYG-92]|uniref:flavin-containing monooxygenase n=1 Tax=Mycolicibacterium sp. lyk4-40-TYG-92 TaxID=3040295 RepID=UPI00254DFA3B|nr:NAD(P)-binding domain-containing protein [Mycolicibacterium sp. lyk4-40-TYG-92]